MLYRKSYEIFSVINCCLTSLFFKKFLTPYNMSIKPIINKTNPAKRLKKPINCSAKPNILSLITLAVFAAAAVAFCIPV